jgi:hypothetical protein
MSQFFLGQLGSFGGQYGSPAPVPGNSPAMTQQPWPPSDNAQPLMNNPGYQALAAQPYVSWSIESVADPRPLIPVSANGDIAMMFFTRTARFANIGAGIPTPVQLGFDTPAAVYARTAGLRTANGTALTVSYANPLDLFDVIFTRQASGNLLDVTSGMGSTLLGTAERPAYIGGRGWQFDNGNSLTITVTPSIAGLIIDITVWYITFVGPQNFVAQGASR